MKAQITMSFESWSQLRIATEDRIKELEFLLIRIGPESKAYDMTKEMLAHTKEGLECLNKYEFVSANKES